MEPKESTKEGKNKSAIVVGSKRGRIAERWTSLLPSPLAKDML